MIQLLHPIHVDFGRQSLLSLSSDASEYGVIRRKHGTSMSMIHAHDPCPMSNVFTQRGNTFKLHTNKRGLVPFPLASFSPAQ